MLVSVEKVDLSGKPFLLIMGNEITERKHAEEALRYNLELLTEVGRIAQVGGWEFDTNSGQVRWNTQVALIHDLDPKTPTSLPLSTAYYTEESKPVIEKAFRKALEKAIPYDLELEIITAKGNHKWIRTIGHPIIEDGKVVKLQGSFKRTIKIKL